MFGCLPSDEKEWFNIKKEKPIKRVHARWKVVHSLEIRGRRLQSI